jgi:hypothetical protein
MAVKSGKMKPAVNSREVHNDEAAFEMIGGAED